MRRAFVLALTVLAACGSPKAAEPLAAANSSEDVSLSELPPCVDEDPALTAIERPASFIGEDTGAWQLFGNRHVVFMGSGSPEPRTPVVSIQYSRGGEGVSVIVRPRQCGCEPIEVGEDIIGPRWRRASEARRSDMVWRSIQSQLRAISKACGTPQTLTAEETRTFGPAFRVLNSAWR